MALAGEQREVMEQLLLMERRGQADRMWGVRWESGARSRSEQASLSRTLRILEERGLILRQNRRRGPFRKDAYSPPPLRTTHVTITELGRGDLWR